MTVTLSEAVMKHLNLTQETIWEAQRTVREDRKQVWCVVCTQERAEMIAKTHDVAVVTQQVLSERGKLSVSSMPKGKTHRY